MPVAAPITLAPTVVALPATALQIDVATAAGFPTTGTFVIQIDDEQMRVTAGDGTTTWTVTRHVNGTTAQSHDPGAPVIFVDPVAMAKLGRVRAILEKSATLLRGEANGILFSQFDADSNTGLTGPQRILNTDSVANATRDGSNQRTLIVLDRGAGFNDPLNPTDIVDGNIVLRVTVPDQGGRYVDVTIPVANSGDAAGRLGTFPANVLNADEASRRLDTTFIRDQLDQIIGAVPMLGTNWPQLPYEAGVAVRYIATPEVTARAGTEWDLADMTGAPADIDVTPDRFYVFELTFQGEVHDSIILVDPTPDGSLGNHMEQTPIMEEQHLQFAPGIADQFVLDANGNPTATPAAQPRNYTIKMAGTTYTPDLHFDPADPAASADALAAALRTIAVVNTAIGPQYGRHRYGQLGFTESRRSERSEVRILRHHFRWQICGYRPAGRSAGHPANSCADADPDRQQRGYYDYAEPAGRLSLARPNFSFDNHHRPDARFRPFGIRDQ